jgi:cytochrome b
MYTKVTKWVSITALLLAMAFRNSAANYQMELNLAVSVAAAVVLIQAVQAKKYGRRRAFAGSTLARAICHLAICPKAEPADVHSIHPGSESGQSVAVTET